MARRRGPALCQSCHAPIAFFRSPFTRNMRTFDPKPLDGRNLGYRVAFPVFGRSAYKTLELIELIQVQRECSDAEAEEEVRDMPWHALHVCLTEPPDYSEDGDE